MKRAWYSFWLRVAFALRLRWPSIWLQRWIKGELKAPKKPIPDFETPHEAAAYAGERFQYRLDMGRLGGLVFPLDWITDPEVFQARLEEGTAKDGDCDDYHYWAAVAVSKIEGVDSVYLLSSGYPGGAHTTAVFRYKGNWLHFDYSIYPLHDPNEAPAAVAKRYTKAADGDPEVVFYVFETLDPPWRAKAIGPDKVPSFP